MSRIPYAVAGLVMASGLAWSLHLVTSPEPWAVDSALVIAIGILVLSVVAMAALLLGRGRWTRGFAVGLLLTELLIVLVADLGPWLVTAVALSALSLAGLSGPWLKGWLRERPSAGSPGPTPIALAIGAFAVVPLVGVAAPQGLEYAHGVAGALGILTSWGYVKGQVWALWTLRLVMPVVMIAAALASPRAGGLLLVLWGAVLALLAWSKDARLAVDPLPTDLPEPRKRRV